MPLIYQATQMKGPYDDEEEEDEEEGKGFLLLLKKTLDDFMRVSYVSPVRW